MTNFRTISIDFDVHKIIELERTSFSESENDALRRLLSLGDPHNIDTVSTKSKKAWTDREVTLPHGTALLMKYNGRKYEGVICDGEWFVEGGEYNSPSGAAIGVAITKNGTKTHLNGKNYWYVKRPGDTDWTLIKELYN